MPIVFLAEFLGLACPADRRDDGTVVVVRVDEHEFGLVV
ncbi:MAG: hypothetical protein ACKOSQ_03350, partial [Planctomycetaceae bacterium]